MDQAHATVWLVETFKTDHGKRDGWYWMVRGLSEGGPYRSEKSARKAGEAWVAEPHSPEVMAAAAQRILRFEARDTKPVDADT